MNTKILVCILASLLISTSVLAGVVYKWSENGKTIYSQTPPPAGIKFEIVEQDSRATNSYAKVDNISVDGSTFEERREQRIKDREQKKLIQESNKIKEENCAIAKRNLESLTSRGQVTIKEDDIYRKLTEEERQQRITNTKEDISEFCG